MLRIRLNNLQIAEKFCAFFGKWILQRDKAARGRGDKEISADKVYLQSSLLFQILQIFVVRDESATHRLEMWGLELAIYQSSVVLFQKVCQIDES